MSVSKNDGVSFDLEPALLSGDFLNQSSGFDLNSQAKFVNFVSSADEAVEEPIQGELSQECEQIKSEIESSTVIKNLFFDFFESIRPFVEKKINSFEV